jgi:aspartate/glutamate racemase
VDRFDSALRNLVREMFSLIQQHAGIGIPLLHIADATAATVRRAGIQKVG